MERIKKILLTQWKVTPLWTKLLASLLIIWSLFYVVDAVLIFGGQDPLTITIQTFTAYALILKILLGVQLVLFVAHLLESLNKKTLANTNVRRFVTKIRGYFRKIHPLLGVSVVFMALAHALWNFSRFLTFSWPLSVQIGSGVIGIVLLLLIAISGDGALFAPVKSRNKVILVHTIIALIFLIPFFVHI